MRNRFFLLLFLSLFVCAGLAVAETLESAPVNQETAPQAPLILPQELSHIQGQGIPQNEEQDYINKLYYRHNKLEIVTRKRLIDEKRNYSTTNIDSSSYYTKSFSNTSTNVSTSNVSNSEVKEIDEWYIYMGGISELNDFEFLKLVGDEKGLSEISFSENFRSAFRLIGNACIGLGAIVMVGGAATSSQQPVIIGGALTMVAGFFISAFSQEPKHFLKPAYVQAKIDAYNIRLKKMLNLPLAYE